MAALLEKKTAHHDMNSTTWLRKAELQYSKHLQSMNRNKEKTREANVSM